MQNYNFKVIAKLKDDLPTDKLEFITNYIALWQEKFNIIKTDDVTYLSKVSENDEFGNTIFFFFSLEKNKDFFSKLEYYDLEEGGVRVAI